jgi:hypothetical protein
MSRAGLFAVVVALGCNKGEIKPSLGIEVSSVNEPAPKVAIEQTPEVEIADYATKEIKFALRAMPGDDIVGTVTCQKIGPNDEDGQYYHVFGKARFRGPPQRVVDWSVSLYRHEDGQIARDCVVLDNQKLYESARLKQAQQLAVETWGNSLGDLPEDFARRIRVVQADVEDAVRWQRRSRPFLFEWPDDPSRHELRVSLAGGVWTLDGKLRYFDGTPRDAVRAEVDEKTGQVTTLAIGERNVLAPKPRVERKADPPKPVRQIAPAVTKPPPTKSKAEIEKYEKAAAELYTKALREIDHQRKRDLLNQIINEYADAKVAIKARDSLTRVP